MTVKCVMGMWDMFMMMRWVEGGALGEGEGRVGFGEAFLHPSLPFKQDIDGVLLS